MLLLLLLLALFERRKRRKYLVALFELERRKRLGRGVGGVGAGVMLLLPYSDAFKLRGRRHQLF